MKNRVKRIATEQKLEARFIKFRPQYWMGQPSLKLELYGCDKGIDKLFFFFFSANTFYDTFFFGQYKNADCRLQTADCRLQTGYKMQTRYKMQTAGCRLGIKCRLRPKLGINCRLSERNVFNVPQCHAIAFPSLSSAKSFLLGAKRQH